MSIVLGRSGSLFIAHLALISNGDAPAQLAHPSGNARVIWYRHNGLYPLEWVACEVQNTADLQFPGATFHAFSSNSPAACASVRYPERTPGLTSGPIVVELWVTTATGAPYFDLLTATDTEYVYVNGFHYTQAVPLGCYTVEKTYLSASGAVRLNLNAIK